MTQQTNSLSSGSGASTAAQALDVTFTISLAAGVGVPLSFTVAGSGHAALPVWFVIAPQYQAFAINGDFAIPHPVTIDYIRPDAIGHDLSGRPVTQGFEGMVWHYPLLADADLSRLMGHYHPNIPQVLVTYPDADGWWQTKTAQLQPINLGSRATVLHTDVALTFTRLA